MSQSFLMVIDSTSAGATQTNDFEVRFGQHIHLGDDRWELALSRLNLWYSWYNISTELNNNTCRYYNGTVFRNITFPDGQYSVEDINDYLHTVMKSFGDFTLAGSTEVYDIEMSPDYPTNKIFLELTNAYTLDLATGDLYLLLGADQADITVTGLFTNIANMTNNINSIWARCSLVEGMGSYVNDTQEDIIYTFVPDTIPNTNIDLSPITLAWIPINVTGNIIRKIRVRITDNLSRDLNLNNEPVTFTFLLRKMKNVEGIRV